MAIGMIGYKRGMTRVFNEIGESIPVTVIEIKENKVTQIKTIESDGYQAIQVCTGVKKRKHATKPEQGLYKKIQFEEIGRDVCEFRLDDLDMSAFKVGQAIDLAMFSAVKDEVISVDVTGTSKGKGFAGAIKRHNFSMSDATHGNSLSHRSAGSIGQNQSPGKVFKGKKMAGHMGNVKRTLQNLEVIDVQIDKRLLLVKGNVPGAISGKVIIKRSIKSKNKDT